MAVIALVRHGQSSANVEGVLAGWLPGVGLTATGRQQAEALGPVLTELSPAHVVTSPLQRCRETAVGADLGLAITTEDGLGECRYGAWTGRRLADLATEPLWREIQERPESAAFPPSESHDAESLAAMAARIETTLARIDHEVESAHGPDAVWVAFSHGDPIKAALAAAAGVGVAGLQRFHVDPASVSLIRRLERDGVVRWMVLSTNHLGHLGGSPAGAWRATATPEGRRAGEAVIGGGAGG